MNLCNDDGKAMTMPQINRFNEEKQSLCMCIVNFWYISLPSSAKQREMTKFKVLWRV